jgi:lipid-A-disaccharide synthase
MPGRDPLQEPEVKVLVSAMEPSGDRLAAELVEELGRRMPVSAEGIAGPRMRAAGVRPLARMEECCAMGIAEVIGRLPAIARARGKMAAAIDAGADIFVGVDAPDFHLPLLRRAKKSGTLSVGFVSPQVWAWRPERVEKVARSMDRLLCLFEFEPPLYPDGFDARWVGHPAVDWIPDRMDAKPFRFGLMPGSRPQELKAMTQLFIETAEVVLADCREASFVLALPPHISPPPLPAFIQHSTAGLGGIRDARAVLCKSGTVTLELALMGMPMVVAHRIHPMTYAIARRQLDRIPFIALPNILSGRMAVAEFRQTLDPGKLCSALLAADGIGIDLSATGDGGAIQNAVEALLTSG